MGKSNAKGYAFEKKVERLLTEWSGQEFRRTPRSGALRWGKSALWTYGDLTPPLGCGIVVECKHHASISLVNLLVEDNKITQFWTQAAEDARRASDELEMKTLPIVVYRQTFHADILLIDLKDFWGLTYQKEPMSNPRHFVIEVPGFSLVAAELQQFLATVSYSRIMDYLKEAVIV